MYIYIYFLSIIYYFFYVFVIENQNSIFCSLIFILFFTYRFMRDHMRYIDELQCAAARIIKGIRDHARKHNRTNINGEFDTFHIRRGDFQYKATRIEAKKIYDNVKDIIPDGTTVYIATDERDKKFFTSLKEHYDVLFMDDFIPLLDNVNKNHYGMIDQLVASRGRIFFGCWHSTYVCFLVLFFSNRLFVISLSIVT